MELLLRNTISDPSFTRDQPWQLSGNEIIYNIILYIYIIYI
jgi:hypothetical protein